jgi:hypothetical protein
VSSNGWRVSYGGPSVKSYELGGFNMSDVTPAGNLGATVESASGYSTNTEAKTEAPKQEAAPTQEPKSENVPRETYEKLLKEKKNYSLAVEDLKASVAAMEAKLKEAAENELRRSFGIQTAARATHCPRAKRNQTRLT